MMDTHRHNGALHLVIDQGGHASRALIFNENGTIVTRASREIHAESCGPDRVEYEPAALLASVREVIAGAAGDLGNDRRQLAAAGLATQRSSVVCWDRFSGEALSPVISWQDRRDHDWLSRLAAGRRTVREITGLPLSAHYGANKLRWCLTALPEVRRAQRSGRLAWGPIASFLLFHLLREQPLVIDPVNAARTLLWDLAAGEWSAILLDMFGLPRTPLPAGVPCRHDFGTLEVGGQAVPLRIVTGDQDAALHAFGRPATDTLHVTIGTGAFLKRATGARLHAVPGLLSGVAFDNGRRRTHVIEGTINGAGSALDWHARHYPDCSHAALADRLDRVSDPPLFLNGVSGLGTPYMMADAPIAFVGNGDCDAQAVAIIESIVFLLQVNIEAMSALPPPLRRIRIGGGLARFDGLCRRLADLSGLHVLRSEDIEATARGLAWLLREADTPGSDPEPFPEPVTDVFEAGNDPALHDRYRRWQTALEQALPPGDDRPRQPRPPTVVAHRGDAGRFPENTLPAIESALRSGVCHVEFDIQMTRDGIPVLMHDDCLQRTTGSRGHVTRSDWQYLQTLRAGEATRFGNRFIDTAIPSLSEVVELLAEWPQAHCFVEIKQESIDAFGAGPVVENVMQATAPRLAQFTPISFDSHALRIASALGAPRIGWVLTRHDETSLALARILSPDFLFCNRRKLPHEPRPVWRGPWHWVVYEITDRTQAMRLAARGIDFIETMQVERFLDVT